MSDSVPRHASPRQPPGRPPTDASVTRIETVFTPAPEALAPAGRRVIGSRIDSPVCDAISEPDKQGRASSKDLLRQSFNVNWSLFGSMTVEAVSREAAEAVVRRMSILTLLSLGAPDSDLETFVEPDGGGWTEQELGDHAAPDSMDELVGLPIDEFRLAHS